MKSQSSIAVIISTLPTLVELADRVNSGRITVCPSSSEVNHLLSPETRLVIIGFDIDPNKVLETISMIRSQSPGVFILWVGDRHNLDALPAISRLADTVLILPDDLGIIDDVVQDSLRRVRRNYSTTYHLRRAGQIIVGLGVFTLLWYLFVKVFSLPPYFLPSPVVVVGEFFRAPLSYLYNTGITAFEAILGFCIGNGIGFLAGIMLHRYILLQQFSLPVFIGLQSIPIVALAPLLIVWFGAGLTSKVAMATIICLFPMVVNTLQAFSGVDREARDLFFIYRASFLAQLRMLLIPSAFPALVAALRISAGLAVVGAIVAELTGADKGLGYILLNASYRLETERLFVAMLLAAGLGGLFYLMPGLLFYCRRYKINGENTI